MSRVLSREPSVNGSRENQSPVRAVTAGLGNSSCETWAGKEGRELRLRLSDAGLCAWPESSDLPGLMISEADGYYRGVGPELVWQRFVV